MIPVEVENRIATYFFHRFLPEEVIEQIVELLLPLCLEADEEDVFDNLVLSHFYN
ncbi:hypothetical protein [Bacillus sp. es.034]|uniref:hypothetical protein n=1 Tax=Bacillus sp. es.034 TaxID=1761763 RepID=UPI000C018F3A|nr:hypothetical protein [Bacillus sp. es.034]PFG07762.1 hypothetical protein ATG71_4671 [Bacillus sp. es.034]